MNKIIDQYLVLLCDMPLYDSGTKFALTMDGEIYLVDPQDDTKLGPLVYTKEQRLEMGNLEDYFIDCGNLNFLRRQGEHFYWYITDVGEICCACETCSPRYYARKRMGNCFPTHGLAEVTRNVIKRRALAAEHLALLDSIKQGFSCSEPQKDTERAFRKLKQYLADAPYILEDLDWMVQNYDHTSEDAKSGIYDENTMSNPFYRVELTIREKGGLDVLGSRDY